jgi:hypothetical protein
MSTSFTRALAGLACALLISAQALATSALLIHHATLRSDPSTHHPALALLAAGEDVELLSATTSHGYYHVRTGEGEEGWIYARNLSVVSDPGTPSQAPAQPTQPTQPTQPSQPSQPASPSTQPIASAFSPDWDKPTPSPTTFTGPDGQCGPTGDGGDAFTNLRKNRTDVPSTYHEVTWSALQSLPYPVAPTSIASWSSAQVAQITPYEGAAVTVTGYLVAIKVEDRGSGESTNCHFVNPEDVDWHMPFAQNAGDAESTAIVVETTPRIRQSHPKWTTTNLAQWVKSSAPVRISGWTLLDPEHRAQLGQYRSTLWEVHPVTRIEVYQNGLWVDLDSFP